jgi:hypothetical protein
MEQPIEQQNEPMMPEQPPEKAAPERPSNITINTPLDRPEFDFFLTQYMNKVGLQDKKQAAIQLTNLLYDSGLDPYSDLKELQGTIKQVTSLLQSLPDSPQAQSVKDTLGAVYTAKVGQALMKKIPQITSPTDQGVDRMQAMMDRYMPMIIAMNTMARMSNMGAEPAGQQQAARPAAAEIPPEVKERMENMEKQLMETQNLLREQAEEKKQREHDERLIASVNASFTPQIASLQQTVESLTSSLAAKQAEPPPIQGPTAEMANITREIEGLKNSLVLKEKTGLNLTDLETVMTTIESIEKRIRRDVPAGEFDWKSTTISTLGEIGKEVVGALKENQAFRGQQYAKAPPGTAGPPGADNRKQIAKQKLQSYILQNLSKGVGELRMDEAQRDLHLAPQEILEAYNELVTEGWIKGKPDANKPMQPQNQPPQQQPTQPGQPQPPQPPQQPSAYEEAVSKLPPGEVPRDRFDANSPFLER